MATDKALYELHRSGYTYRQIAEQYTFDEDGVRGRVWRYAHRLLNALPDETPFDVRIGNRAAMPISVARLDDIPVIKADQIVVTSDWQIPTTDWQMVELMNKFGDKHCPKGKRKLAIVGDLMNADAASKYDHILPPPSMELEMATSEATIEYVLDTFDEIWYCMGNHDHRWMKLLQGALTATRFGKMLTRYFETGRIKMTMQTQLHLVSGGVHWRLTHQRNYSRNKGIVGQQLAVKHQSDIMTTHEHHAAMGRDPYNRYTWVNNPMLGDYEKMIYVGIVDSTSPVMCTGFTYFEDGTAHLLTPYPSMTSWNRWGMESEALLAIVAAQAREARLQRPDDARDGQLKVVAKDVA